MKEYEGNRKMLIVAEDPVFRTMSKGRTLQDQAVVQYCAGRLPHVYSATMRTAISHVESVKGRSDR